MDHLDIDLQGCKLLVVDDVPANLDVLIHALEDQSYDILVATSGEAALQVARRSRPDLILLDVMMPGLNGYQTCRRLKEDEGLAPVPVIYLTARDDLEGLIEGFEAGGLDYVTKPFKKEEVLARVRTHLERALLARRLAELNASLEDKVRERTAQLRQKVRELEGKDRITQHLLRYHSLDETLDLVLDTLTEVLGLGHAAVFLEGPDGPRLARSTPGGADPASWAPSEAQTRAFGEVQRTRAPARLDDAGPVLVPVIGGEAVLGYIEAAGKDGPLDGEALRTLDSFALQAAVAVRDAQVRQEPGAWDEELDEVLEIGDELAEADGFDALARDLEDESSRD